MTGDYTKVPLRPGERWTGARMQQGRPMLDSDWNLNLDATARTAQAASRAVIGPAGVPEGSDAFRVGISGGALTIQPGRMWVNGLAAHAPEAFAYQDQDQIDPQPTTGRVMVFLDVFEEHIQPAEHPDELIDPALDPVDTCARTRIGWRVRAVPTSATTCAGATAALPAQVSTGRLTITRGGQPVAADPCDPPGDPLGLLPDGLLRVEVLDAGTASSARFVWSADNGAAAVPATVAGNTASLAPSPSVKFVPGDQLEVSWLARRADRADHGSLYQVTDVVAAAGGDTLLLDRAITAPAGANGLVVRRWDGQSVGATSAVTATVRGLDLGLRFRAAAGTYLPGDYWGAWLRPETAVGVEPRAAAPPDGIPHAFAPLALVDLDAGTVLVDCRRTFRTLVEVSGDRPTCTVQVFPGDDLQAAVNSLPPGGGEICLAAGEFPRLAPVVVAKRNHVVICGVGPATVVRAQGIECALRFENCTEVEICRLHVVGGTPLKAQRHLDGAVTFVACTGVRVSDCDLACPPAAVLAQACLTVRGPADRVAIDGNRCTVGAWQAGILVIDSVETTVSRNTVRLSEAAAGPGALPQELFATELAGFLHASPPRRLGAQLRPFLQEFERRAPDLLATHRSRAAALLAFTRVAAAPERPVDLPQPLWTSLQRLLTGFVAAGQGIVVAGRVLAAVRVLDNLVTGTVRGLHIGASDAATPGRQSATSVLVSRNTVDCLVPSFYRRDRHAVFVGNTASVSVLDTTATLRRVPRSILPPTPVEGIRVHGVLGPYLAVRHSNLDGFRVGVRVRALLPVPNREQRMWLVAETMAAGATTAVDAPDVLALHNFP